VDVPAAAGVPTVGVDIGGTEVAAGVVDAAGFVDADRSTVRFAPDLAWRDEPLGRALGSSGPPRRCGSGSSAGTRPASSAPPTSYATLRPGGFLRTGGQAGRPRPSRSSRTRAFVDESES
jgi:hypothetical protein